MFFNLTPVVKNLIIINVIVFIGDAISGDMLNYYLGLHDVNSERFRPYQLFTYMFCHGDFFHIFFNMLLLAFMAPILEEFWGQKRFLLFYIITGLGAGVLNVLIVLLAGIGNFYMMVGASGAVYGIMTAFGVIFPNMELRLMFLPFSFRAKYLVMVLGSIAIYSAFMPRAGDNTAHFAHLGGIVIAIILLQFWRGRGS